MEHWPLGKLGLNSEGGFQEPNRSEVLTPLFFYSCENILVIILRLESLEFIPPWDMRKDNDIKRSVL